MKAKKNPRFKLDNYCRMFLLLGLVTSLLFVYFALEMETKTTQSSDSYTQHTYKSSDEILIPEVIPEIQPEIPTPSVAAPQPILENLEIVSDNKTIIEDIVFESTEASEIDTIIVRDVIAVEDVKEIIIVEEVQEDVPFRIIENVPVFPGCIGNRAELSMCLEENIRQHIAANFNSELAQELGLPVGKMLIFVQFTIVNDGTITNIRTRAPHKKLEKEAVRVIKTIPKMKAGSQRGRPVRVRYNLPIIFNIMEAF